MLKKLVASRNVDLRGLFDLDPISLLRSIFAE